MVYIILRCVIYFFCSLQNQIFSSSAYKRFREKDLENLKAKAEAKSLAIAYLFNNRKLEKIVRIWNVKQEIEAKLKALRAWYDQWGPLYETLLQREGGGEQSSNPKYLEAKKQAMLMRQTNKDIGSADAESPPLSPPSQHLALP